MIKSTCIFFFLGLVSFLSAQEMGFEEYNPIPTLVVSENPVKKARFPVVDIHSHHFKRMTL